MENKNYKVKITLNVFIAIKTLLENGATLKECAKYMKISYATAKYIKAAENYDEYKAILASMAEKQRARYKNEHQKKEPAPAPEKALEPKAPEKTEPQVQVIEHKQTVTVQATWQMMQEMQKTNKLLEGISNKLAFIVDELCGIGSKGAN